MARVSLVKLLSYEYHWTLLVIGQHWCRQWLGAIRQQHVDPVLCRHMACDLNYFVILVWQMIENSLFPQMNSTHKGFIWYVRQKKVKCDVINRPPRSREIWRHIEECHKEASHTGRWNDWRRCWFCIITLHYVIMQLYLPLSSCCVLSAYRWSSNVDIDRHAVCRPSRKTTATGRSRDHSSSLWAAIHLEKQEKTPAPTTKWNTLYEKRGQKYAF